MGEYSPWLFHSAKMAGVVLFIRQASESPKLFSDFNQASYALRALDYKMQDAPCSSALHSDSDWSLISRA